MLNRKQVSALTLVGALLLSGLVTGTAAIGAAESPTEITNCTTIDESGEYVLAGDIQNESADTCLSVQADDVTIDGNGHTIDGVDQNGTGIGTAGSQNVTVRDVTVTRFETGVVENIGGTTIAQSTLVRNVVGATVTSDVGILDIRDSEIKNNVEDGVFVDSGELNIVGTTISGNADGVHAVMRAQVSLDDNLVENNQRGVYAEDADVLSKNNVVRWNDVAGYAISGALESTGDGVFENGGIGVSVAGTATIEGAVISENGESGLAIAPGISSGAVEVTDSEIERNGGDGVNVADGSYDYIRIHNSTIFSNDGLGVNNQDADEAVNATGNYWGADDGPGSAEDEDAPFEDIDSDKLAWGGGDEVSESSEPGVSSVDFYPFLDSEPGVSDGDGDDGDENNNDDDEDDQNDNDNQNDDDRQEQSDAAYQFDVAVGDVIETLGDDESDFYGVQDRLVRAQTVTDDGTMTGRYIDTDERYTEETGGCEVITGAVEYDSETSTAEVEVTIPDDASCEEVTLTLAAYELPGDDTTFVREHADDQELLDHNTATLEPGERVTLRVDVDGEDGDE